MSIKGSPDLKEIPNRVLAQRQLRLLMDATESDLSSDQFLETLDSRYHRRDQVPSVILRAWEYSIGIEYEHGNVPARIYLNHPLRVATMIAREVSTASEHTLVVALLHNVLEVSKISFNEIKELFGEPVALAILALTIDRSRQDREYLNKYYAGIAAAPVNCAAVKVADKLDNIYMICFNPSHEIRSRYLDEIDEWVVPLALTNAPRLAPRLIETVAVMRQTGFLCKETELEIARKSNIYENAN